MKILILEHESECPPHYFADWASRRGHSLDQEKVPELERWPEPGGYDLVVSLGSDCSVHASPEQWIRDERSFIRDADRASVPVFGICFGGQILADALGGSVRRASAVRASWTELPSLAPELVSPGPWFRWHEDVFAIPPGARLLVGSSEEPLAFLAGVHVGLQFHPEVSPELATAWIDGGRERLLAQRIDERRLLAEIDTAGTGAVDRAFALFDNLAAGWAREAQRRRLRQEPVGGRRRIRTRPASEAHSEATTGGSL